MKLNMPNGSVEIDDNMIREYARTKLNMKALDEDIEKLIEARVETGIAEAIKDDPVAILDEISEEEFRSYAGDQYEMMTLDDFQSDWTSHVDECEIEDYARDSLGMMNEDDAIDFAKEKLDQ